MSDGVLLKGPVQQANETRRREGKTADKSVTSQETQISVTESLFVVWRMSLVVPLYYGCWCIGGRRIETNEFCLQERSTNEVFDGRPALFDMFDI